MVVVPQKTSYVTYLALPTPVVVPALLLLLIYLGVLLFDYILVKSISTSPRTAKIALYSVIVAYHFSLPILLASKYDFGNISFMIQPWTLAAQIVYLANKTTPSRNKQRNRDACPRNNSSNSDNSDPALLVFKDWLSQMATIATFQDTSATNLSSQQIRLQGLRKLIRGLAKAMFMKWVLDDRVLPADLSIILSYPFYSPKALFLTYALALKIYCMMSVMDIVMGIVQAVTLIRFYDIFDNPFVSTSPKDFWNRRWNRAVSRLYHRFIFTQFVLKGQSTNNAGEKKSEETMNHLSDKSTSQNHVVANPSSGTINLHPTLCGLLVFFISGLIHDLMIAVAARVITFELTVFFLIHGIAVALEVQYGKMKRRKNSQFSQQKRQATAIPCRAVCVVLTTLFFLTTGRLFINPILQQEVFLRIAKRF